MNDPNQILVFDRALVRRHRDRAAENFARHDDLFREIAGQMIERLGDIKQEFHAILDLGAHAGDLARHFAERGAAFVVAADVSERMLRVERLDSPPLAGGVRGGGVTPESKLPVFRPLTTVPSLAPPHLTSPARGEEYLCVADEEFLPFAPESFDLIVSNLSLHWVNDLPGALAQIKAALKPGGLFLATLIGGASLFELRACLMEAELAVTGGVSPRLSPTVELRAASALMQRAGFALPVTDQEKITLTYADAFALMRDLRGMGETNAHLHRLRRPARRKVFTEAARLYRERFADADGRIPATFEMVFLHGVRG